MSNIFLRALKMICYVISKKSNISFTMSNGLRAILLSAGLGTRLRPLTNKKPKCLMEINNVPILRIWIEKLAQIGCTEILINTHYLAEQVRKFIEDYHSNSIKITISHEKTLLGTAGTLIKNIDFVNGDTIFMHSDNFTTCDLNGLLEMNKNKAQNCLLTMLTFETDKPSSCGVVETDKNGILKAFYEKVDNPPSKIANGAIYIFDKEFVNWLKEQKEDFVDFSKDVLPKLINKIQTWHTKDFFIDIGTPESLKLAQLNAISKKKVLKN